MNRLPCARVSSLLFVLAFLLFSPPAHGANCDSSWIGSGIWGNPLNWQPNGIPNSAGVNVCLTNGISGSPASTELSGSVAVATMQIGGLNALNIDNGVTLSIHGAQVTNAGAISVNGSGSSTEIYVGSGGTMTLTGMGTLTLADSSHSGTTFISGDNSVTLENVNNVIQGEGQIGFGGNGMALRNDALGIINANVSGQLLNVKPLANTVNAGLMEATGGGLLDLSNIVNNAAGTIGTDSGKGSTVLLDNSAYIQGGLLSGNVQTAPSFLGPTLDGITRGALTNAGTLTVSNLTRLNLANNSTINNTGAIALGSSSLLVVGNAGVTTLTGNGTMTMSSLAGIYGDGGMVLENVNNAIAGQGEIGELHNVILQNDAAGIVNANVAGQTLYLNSAAGVININRGLIEATGGGILNLQGTIDNTGGTIGTDSGQAPASVIQLGFGADIQGGTLHGNVQTFANGTATLDGITHGVLNNAGTVTAIAGTELKLANGSTINNTGTIALNGAALNSTLYIGNGAFTATLMGGGTITLANSLHNGLTAILGDNGVVLNNVNNLIQGEGSIGVGLINGTGGTLLANVAGQLLFVGGATLANNGTMQVNAGSFLTTSSALAAGTYNAGTLLTGTYIVNGGRMEIDGFGNHAAGEIVTNAANIVLNGTGALFTDAGGNAALKPLAANSGSFTIEGGYNFTSVGNLANSGAVAVESGSTLTANGYNQSAGTTTVDGTLAASNVNINGGMLMGTGTVHGNVTIGSGAALLPGDDLSTPGAIDLDSLTLNGTLDEVLALDLDADAYDFSQLLTTGTVNLGGTLDISLLDGYVPNLGSQFFFIDSATVNGVFSKVNGSIINGNEYLAVIYNPASVELCVEATGSTACGGSAPPVPEPGSVVLMAGALLAAGWYGRRRTASGTDAG